MAAEFLLILEKRVTVAGFLKWHNILEKKCSVELYEDFQSA